jgi:uncharacterized protein DUF6950
MTTVAAHLDAYLRDRQRTPFDWRSNSCIHFAAGWVRLAEGTEVALPDGLRGAVALRDACGGVAAAVSAALRRPPLDNVRMAQAGDVVLMPARRSGRAYIGLCCGYRSAFMSSGESELVFALTVGNVSHAWRVATEGLP